MSGALHDTIPGGAAYSSVLRICRTCEPSHPVKATRECTKSPETNQDTFYRLLITQNSIRSRETSGTVFSTIEIEEDNTLYDLHWEIQNAFDWDNDHLYSFYMSNKKGDTHSEFAGNPMGEDLGSTFGELPGSAVQTEPRVLKLKKGKKFKYLFDYGDDLIHTVEVLDTPAPTGDAFPSAKRVKRMVLTPGNFYGFSSYKCFAAATLMMM